MFKGALYPRVGLHMNLKENLGNLERNLSGRSEKRL